MDWFEIKPAHSESSAMTPSGNAQHARSKRIERPESINKCDSGDS
eukprot:CAMPEP_0198147464 /NCGR_PEP_ID=MMETSP1443-20131203/35933_1 /TAXON_ID=186043 /ORGANISM="Entomoneis sp., Strain CCMP2396" /LENGTH=44 /DNA_ID= /DNA_START= /DNA_END= /DNA_ORIENTATION=